MSQLEFPISKIASVTDARNNFNKIVDEVEKDHEGKYLLTKGGNPSVVMVNASYLEKLIGEKPLKELSPKRPPTVKEKSIPTSSQVSPQPQPETPQSPTPAPSPLQPPGIQPAQPPRPFQSPTASTNSPTEDRKEI